MHRLRRTLACNRAVGQLARFGDRHASAANRDNRSLLPTVANVELISGVLKGSTRHVAGGAAQPHNQRRYVLGSLFVKPSGISEL